MLIVQAKINPTASYFIIAVLFVWSLHWFCACCKWPEENPFIGSSTQFALGSHPAGAKIHERLRTFDAFRKSAFFQVLSIKPARWCKYWWCTILPQIFADIWGQVSSDQSEGRVFLCLHMHFFSGALRGGWESLGSMFHGSMSFRILLNVCRNHSISHWVLGVLLQLDSEGENKREIFQSYFQIQ